ncbi:molybdate ABC transporter substrate-binding protein [Polaromonas sp.]|uniref:molybdate ABC transporter substrate-binding protein n=1 Tax=Polaromonas sp. TaxID=1869339 RepID=UPI0032643132
MTIKSTHGVLHMLQALLLVGVLPGGLNMAHAQPSAAPAEGAPLRVYAAGSLREALTEAARAYEARTGVKTQLTFGASGLLRERIEKGEPAQVFASADTQHPQRLHAMAASAWAQPTLFVRNQLCALAVPQLNADPAKLLGLMLDPAVKLGTSTPKADPSGDYAWEVFRKAEALKSGAYAALDAKALKLTGSPEAAQPPTGRGAYEWLITEGRADLFLTYCTNAVAVRKEVPRMSVVQMPPALQVSAAYGLTARSGDGAAAQFSAYLLTPEAQDVFRRFGFGAP